MKKKAACLALVCAALGLLVASTSSPLYATNFWTDTNIYFTIGRGMTSGLMPYRDLFDHKGPLLFLIYAAGAMISNSSFLGVYLLEVLSLAAALYFGWKIVCLYGEGDLTLVSIPILAAVTLCSRAFTQGGSAEEFVLPALLYGLYAALCRMRGGESRLLDVFFGAAVSWVFLIKYTDCGLFFGLGFFLVLYVLCTDGLKEMFLTVLRMAAGFAVPAALAAAYLALNGALKDCIDVYFIQNLFEYSGEPMTFGGHIYNALAYLRTQSIANPAIAALSIFGCLFVLTEALVRWKNGFAALAVPVSAGLLLLFCYWGEMAHPYYALVFAALCPLGMCPLGMLAERLPVGRILAWAATASLVPACLGLCQAVPMLKVKKADMPQTKFAEIMNQEENPTLLDLTSLDQGFYLAAGILPNCRYFADNNLQTEEKKNAISTYLEDRRVEFVVTRYKEPGDGYVEIAEADGVFDLNDKRTYKLYKKAAQQAEQEQSEQEEQ